MNTSSCSLQFIPIGDADLPFLGRLYASTREHEMAHTDWDAEQAANFLASQFAIQHRYYQEHYPYGNFMRIDADGAPIGRVYWHWSEQDAHLNLIDIALLPAWRGRGIGSQLLARLMDMACQRGLPLVLHVEQYNPALRMYQRLGFRESGPKGAYIKMQWQADYHLQLETNP